ncbi:hypothetical protein SODALDRAFT_355326 [Sodiomyces alkalinus F11]|uniref:Uncharacterized protein n=1 Tax=Sodiomyces alkalinus (strain CBS 110278 / VKM F-3762 / F11) TaxID=1314773 RepID=A0A3N2Q8R6_SODAK|nr:hypothetical protein SODALDRAFT_355326 [Sodiomyces alkalinus F11]ROT43130.1 hypothetical protein SODALDRAFT_355326 [Sodiomyces alkalinus F11]
MPQKSMNWLPGSGKPEPGAAHAWAINPALSTAISYQLVQRLINGAYDKNRVYSVIISYDSLSVDQNNQNEPLFCPISAPPLFRMTTLYIPKCSLRESTRFQLHPSHSSTLRQSNENPPRQPGDVSSSYLQTGASNSHPISNIASLDTLVNAQVRSITRHCIRGAGLTT